MACASGCPEEEGLQGTAGPGNWGNPREAARQGGDWLPSQAPCPAHRAQSHSDWGTDIDAKPPENHTITPSFKQPKSSVESSPSAVHGTGRI